MEVRASLNGGCRMLLPLLPKLMLLLEDVVVSVVVVVIWSLSEEESERVVELENAMSRLGTK